jgi:hypothetical protein
VGNINGWIFKADGSLIQIAYNKRYNWHWEVKGGRIYFGYKTVKAGSHRYKIDGNKLYMYLDAIKDWGVPLYKQ